MPLEQACDVRIIEESLSAAIINETKQNEAATPDVLMVDGSARLNLSMLRFSSIGLLRLLNRPT